MLQDEIIQRVHLLLAAGGRKILGIAGAPGAGKSTLAKMLVQEFGQNIVVVPMDGFHLANEELLRLGRRERKGAPDTFDSAGYVTLLQRIRLRNEEQTVYAPAFHREIDQAVAGEIAVEPNVPLIITEGNYLLLQDGCWSKIRQYLDEVWFMDVATEQRQAQLLARHMRYGRTREEALAWIEKTDEPNARQIMRTAHLADYHVPWSMLKDEQN
ncbi:nucleoside/nucleotide kinase family protein [Swingsia samuiensis]|uniref:Nucleoside/nucleotide kinase family protein n=1 Tax=Swingsia samuiensis TaxID=1293412 RepID=A0A4Y6UJI4_9PROT|nr:nucleoside/nucleotide kinase family protein [Swingsia samuiensis]QDH17732.1 nucleoside/nucleotide kinase family protein [Swingsia samuiensis]